MRMMRTPGTVTSSNCEVVISGTHRGQTSSAMQPNGGRKAQEAVPKQRTGIMMKTAGEPTAAESTWMTENTVRAFIPTHITRMTPATLPLGTIAACGWQSPIGWRQMAEPMTDSSRTSIRCAAAIQIRHTRIVISM